MKNILLMLIILIVPVISFAIDVQAYVDSKNVGEMEYVKLNVEISGKNSGDIKSFPLPEIDGLKYIGQSESSSTSMAIINGKVKSEIKKIFTFSLMSTKIGEIIIPPLTLEFKNKKYMTEPITINVQKGNSTNITPSRSRRFSNNRGRFSENNIKVSDEAIFIKPEIKKRNLYVGEAIEISYYLYNKYSLGDLTIGEEPKTDGFWKEDLYTAKRLEFHRVNVNGEIYERIKLKTYRLTPSKVGNFIVSPFIVNAGILVGGNSFFSFGQQKEIIVKSKPINISVVDLPKPVPDSFYNAIGDFSFATKISNNTVKVGDSFTYTIILKGNGNFSQIEEIKLKEIPHFRFIEPEIKTENKGNGLTERVIKYLIIPQEEGDFVIPKIKFSYFDPKQKTYKTIYSKNFDINVQKGDNLIISSVNSQNRISLEGKDIGFIISKSNFRSNKLLFNSMLYWALYFIFIIASIVFFIRGKENRKMGENLQYSRSKLADKVIRKYLNEATKSIDDNNLFYANIQNGLNNYLCDKLKLNRGLSSEELIEKLKESNITEELIINIRDIINYCNKARFMPGNLSKNNNEMLTDVKDIIKKVSKLK